MGNLVVIISRHIWPQCQNGCLDLYASFCLVCVSVCVQVESGLARADTDRNYVPTRLSVCVPVCASLCLSACLQAEPVRACVANRHIYRWGQPNYAFLPTFLAKHP